MGAFVSGLAVALFAVNYGWVPASSDADGDKPSSDGYDYVVQLDAEELRALAEGRVGELSSAPPKDLQRIDRVKIVVGNDPPPRELSAVDRDSPRRIAASEGPVKQTVAKPVTPDWLPPREETPSDPQRRTSYQNPQYVNPSAVQQGFQQGSNVVTNAAGDLGQATRQTGRDVRDGALGVVRGLRDAVTSGVQGTANAINNTVNIGNDRYFDERQQPNATAPNNNQRRFEAFSYNNPTPSEISAPPTQAPTQAPQQFPQDAPAPAQFTTPANQPTGPALAQPTPAANDGDIATRFGAGRNEAEFARNENAPLAPVPRNTANTRFIDSEQGFRNDRNFDQPSNLSQNRQPVGGSFDNYRNDAGYNQADAGYNRGYNNGQQASPPSRFDDWDRGNFANNNSNPNTGFSTPSGFGAPPAQLPPRQGSFPTDQTVGFGNRNNTGNSSANDPTSWNDPQSVQQTSAQQPLSAEETLPKNPWEDSLALVLLAISLAGNLYVVTGYLDVRNKYRAALRRLPIGMQNNLAA